jgi:hypothetical protein
MLLPSRKVSSYDLKIRTCGKVRQIVYFFEVTIGCGEVCVSAAKCVGL